MLDIGAPYRLVYNIAFGDTPHVVAPVVIERSNTGARRVVGPTAPRQLQIAVRDQLALIANEYSGASPFVVDLASGRVVWSDDGVFALWLSPAGER